MSLYPETQLLIANVWRDSSDGKRLEVLNPATGQAIGTVASASRSDLDDAVAAAYAGFMKWRDVSAYKRASTLKAAATLLKNRAQDIATVLTQEQGKPLAEARAEIASAVSIIEWFAEEGCRVYGRVVPPRDLEVQQLVLKEPIGPVAAFTPWNFPINQVARKLCAALATGCSFLVKGPEETPASPAALIKVFVDAGVPPGTVGLVYGNPGEISTYLISHPIIKKVTFTGSTPVGKELASLAGRYMKRVTMELGGHAPVIVAADADVELAIDAMTKAKFRNAGQICIAPTRFLVHSSIKEEFTAGLVRRAENFKIGDGLDDGTTMGPVANPRRLRSMQAMVQDATARGALIATGGERVGTSGYFFAPTVLSDVPLDADVFNDEPFGPIAAIRGFESLDEAMAEANRLAFGLAGYGFTRSVKTAHFLSRRMEVGMLWLNQPAIASPEMPFGGVKDSGYGSEGGPEALEAYLVTKAVSLANS